MRTNRIVSGALVAMVVAGSTASSCPLSRLRARSAVTGQTIQPPIQLPACR